MKKTNLVLIVAGFAVVIYFLMRRKAGGKDAAAAGNVQDTGIGGITDRFLAAYNNSRPNPTRPTARAKNSQSEQLRAAGQTAAIQAAPGLLKDLISGVKSLFSSSPNNSNANRASDPSDPMSPGYNPLLDPNYQDFGLDGNEADQPWTRNFSVEDPAPDPVYNYDLGQYEEPYIDPPNPYYDVDAPTDYQERYFGA